MKQTENINIEAIQQLSQHAQQVKMIKQQMSNQQVKQKPDKINLATEKQLT